MSQSDISRMNRFNVLALPVLGGLCLFGCNRQSAPPSVPSGQQSAAVPTRTGEQGHHASSDELPDWYLAETDSSSLSPPYKMSPFEIRPPANFRFIKYIPESKTHYWVGPVRSDETYPQFMVIITELSARDTNASLAALLSDVMGAIKQRRTDWSETPVEQGKINGLPFVRNSWSGVASSAAREGLAGRTMHGVVYLTIHNNQAVQIMCQDVAPDHAEWLKLGGFAALTFRVIPTENTSP